jgi:hypothetical protein
MQYAYQVAPWICDLKTVSQWRSAGARCRRAAQCELKCGWIEGVYVMAVAEWCISVSNVSNFSALTRESFYITSLPRATDGYGEISINCASAARLLASERLTLRSMRCLAVSIDGVFACTQYWYTYMLTCTQVQSSNHARFKLASWHDILDLDSPYCQIKKYQRVVHRCIAWSSCHFIMHTTADDYSNQNHFTGQNCHGDCSCSLLTTRYLYT